MKSLKPTSAINYTGDNHVEMIISCTYPSGETKNTADQVWDIVADFSNVKTIFPTLLRNYLSYPDQTQKRVGTIRDMTFGGNPISTAIEKLTAVDYPGRSLTYISLAGLPVTNYSGVMSVLGDNRCTLTWTVNYDQKPIDKDLAKGLAKLFVTGEKEIGKVLF